MIAGLALLLQTAVADPVVIRAVSGRVDTIPVTVAADGGERVSGRELARALGGAFSTPAAGRMRLQVGSVAFDFVDGAPFVAAGDRVYPLVDVPEIEANSAYLPLAFVADVVPRVLSGYAFASAGRELRAFSTVARRPTRERVSSPPSSASDPSEVVPPGTSVTGSARRHSIVVDAGHGGPDGGMSATFPGGLTVTEKDVTLGVARALQAILRERGVGVVMTRTRDTLIALADRGRIANERQGDLFVSIHVNAANPGWRDAAAARGFETYFLAEAKTDDARRLEQMENESVRFETGPSAGRSDPLSFIITDMAQNEHLRESSELAARVQRRLGRAHPGPSRGVKQAGFKVLVSAFMPAVLVEIGFGTNAGDSSYMASARGQRALAEAIADAAVEYLADYDRRVARGGAR